MKCNTPIDPESKLALEGEALEAALEVESAAKKDSRAHIGFA